MSIKAVTIEEDDGTIHMYTNLKSSHYVAERTLNFIEGDVINEMARFPSVKPTGYDRHVLIFSKNCDVYKVVEGSLGNSHSTRLLHEYLKQVAKETEGRD